MSMYKINCKDDICVMQDLVLWREYHEHPINTVKKAGITVHFKRFIPGVEVCFIAKEDLEKVVAVLRLNGVQVEVEE